MKRVHFDSKGPVKWHYFFWEPWGCAGCFLRTAGFVALLALFLFLLSQFRSCRSAEESMPVTTPTQPVSVVVPPINEDDVIDDDGHQLVANRLNVLFDLETGQAEYESWVEQFTSQYPAPDYQILFYDPNTKLMSIQVPADRRVAMITELPERIPDIPFLVFEESVMEMGLRPNDPVFGHTDHAYHYDAIRVYDAWDITMGSPDVTIAVVDSYFDLDNVEFAETAIATPYSVVRGDSTVSLPADYNPQQPNPVYAHGTMVAALAMGGVGNGRAAAGMAPRCRFLPVSLGHRFGCLAMLQGILYAMNHGATVINISAGLSLAEDIANWPVEQQIQAARTELLAQEAVWHYVFDMARRNYVTIVWAAGNDNIFLAIDASKRGDETIKVSATDASMSKAEFSNFGNIASDSIYESTISAPGAQVPGLVPGTSGYMLVDGTSFSAPIVAGCVGLMKSIDPTLTTPELIDIMKSTGQPVRGTQGSTIGPILQIGPALSRIYSTIVSFDDFTRAISGGTGSFKFCEIDYLTISDPTALPPIYTMELHPTGPGTGKLRYISNRPNQEPVEAAYRATVSEGRIHLECERSSADASGNAFGTVDITIEPNEAGKAAVTDASASWWTDFHPFLIKTV